jgi:hypothetical protein
VGTLFDVAVVIINTEHRQKCTSCIRHPPSPQRISDVNFRMDCVPVYLENGDGVDGVVRK